MKIKKINTYALEQELPIHEHFAFSQAMVKKRSVFVCNIITDEGISGWGESFGPCRIHKTIIDNYYTPYLLDKNPLDSQVIWDHLYNMFRDNGQKGLNIQALSAIDIALWDIKGKYFNVPVYQLMGGAARDRLKLYATGNYRKYTKDEIERTVRESESYVEEGFSAVKIKTGFGLEYDLALVSSIRKQLGDDIELMIDANHGYNARDAIEVGRKLEQFNITWFEEPVPPEDHDGYLEVKNALNMAIAGGEAEFTRYGMKPLIEKRCVDILQPDCTITGGLSEFKNIATLCTIANIQCIPHVWGSGIALATGIHAGLSAPDFPQSLEPKDMWLEYDRTPNIFREELAIGLPKLENGYISKPIGAGLGIEVNEDVIKHYAVT